jgi:hypothetical protein
MSPGRKKFCSDECREEWKISSNGSVHARHASLIRALEKERVPQTDKLWSEDFYEALISDGCQYCTGSLSPSGIALDRIINSLGHRCWNVIACCSTCNGIKGDILTFEEMVLLRDGLVAIQARRQAREAEKKKAAQ